MFTIVVCVHRVVTTDVVRKGIQFNAIDFELLRTSLPLRQLHVSYMNMLEEVDFTSLPKNEAIAFLINAYNAFATDLIVTENPPTTIRSIPGVFGLKKWTLTVNGELVEVSLDDVEHKYLRMEISE